MQVHGPPVGRSLLPRQHTAVQRIVEYLVPFVASALHCSAICTLSAGGQPTLSVRHCIPVEPVNSDGKLFSSCAGQLRRQAVFQLSRSNQAAAVVTRSVAAGSTCLPGLLRTCRLRKQWDAASVEATGRCATKASRSVSVTLSPDVTTRSVGLSLRSQHTAHSTARVIVLLTPLYPCGR